MPSGDDDASSCTSGSLAVLYGLMQHEAHSSEASLLGQSGTEAGSRLFVGNLTMHSEASSSQESDFPLPPPPPPPPKSLHGTEPDGAGISVLEFAVENFPAFPQPENNAVATESLEIAHEGFLGDSKGVINWFSGDGGTISDPGTFPTETTRPMKSDGQDDGWCMATEIDSPENTNGVDDDTSSCTSGSLAVLYALVDYDLIV